MKFSFHNKLEVLLENETLVYYNKILPSLLTQLSNFESYTSYLSIGNGISNSESQNNCKLTHYLTQTPVQNKSIQSEIDKDTLYAVYEFKIKRSFIESDYISEVGLSEITNNEINNPTIYNYFSLISDTNPNGLQLSNQDEILFRVTIYLTITESDGIMLTSGKNTFIEFLLGNGMGEIYLIAGSNYAENIRLNRTITENQPRIQCTKSSKIENNKLILSFDASITNEEINEILFVTNNKVFARKNLKEFNPTQTTSDTVLSKENYVIKLEEDVKSVRSLKRTSDSDEETNYIISKYANSFGDEVYLPFNNIFNSSTSRFVSKDGSLIFFIIGSKVYAYLNHNFMITEINTHEITDENIRNIIAFQNYIFVISETMPYISTYILNNNIIRKIENNFETFEYYSKFETMQQIDITSSNEKNFMLGFLTDEHKAITLYFSFSDANGFVIENYLTNSKEFNYVLAMINNSFCDARMIYLKEGESSAYCRLVTHYPDETETDVYTSMAYYLTNNSTKVYTKNRAIISEKTISPKVVIYYYPQIYEYKLPLLADERNNYISHDLNYIIQKNSDGSFSTYNLVGYDTPEKFKKDIGDLLNENSIIDIEFMKDTLLVFLNKDNKQIVAFNLNLNKTQIENVSLSNDSYLVEYEKYDKLGNKTTNIKFTTQVEL